MIPSEFDYLIDKNHALAPQRALEKLRNRIRNLEHSNTTIREREQVLRMEANRKKEQLHEIRTRFWDNYNFEV